MNKLIFLLIALATTVHAAAPPSSAPGLKFIASVPSTSQTVFVASNGVTVLTINPTGRLFWKGREVKTDKDLRRAMKDVAAAFQNRCVEWPK